MDERGVKFLPLSSESLYGLLLLVDDLNDVLFAVEKIRGTVGKARIVDLSPSLKEVER
ncbi:MAG: hypothetical protein GWN31_15080 [Candidatus Thorarchaeota archaeon]|nr:hypothetical protein [Candidatus Thorarchaeota archaeon]NIW15217.1 hypothetical protein [Candidatus Thorarchaeota archaeon]NIW53194.1 hypothetical protein [Candidatus Korarchaeota archaeon]